MDRPAAGDDSKSSWSGLKTTDVSLGRTSVPPWIFAGTPAAATMRSSNSVAMLPFGRTWGAGANILPRDEYWGARLLSPPE